MDKSDFFVPLPAGITPGWSVSVDYGDGNLEKLFGIRRAKLENTRLGVKFLYGKSPAGNYDQVWREGGGGAVTILFSKNPEGKRFIGFLKQKRPLQDESGLVIAVIRGMQQLGEKIAQTALRELAEEAGQEIPGLIDLGGADVNMDSAFFDTRDGGVRFFAAEVPWSLLNPVDEYEVEYSFRSDHLTEEQKKEGIFQVIFGPDSLTGIAELGDAFTLIAYLKLLAYDARSRS